MKRITNDELIRKAGGIAKVHKVSKDVAIGDVGCALVSGNNNVYVGVSIEACCGIGFCAEHSAIAAMASTGEYRVRKIVAVSSKGVILPPCGRCRELIYQINGKNPDAEVIIGKNKAVKLKELLPEPWQKR